MNGSMDAALDSFRAARELYVKRRFSEAFNKANEYRRLVNYAQLKKEDRRPLSVRPTVSVIIVLYKSKLSVIECIESLVRQASDASEIIIVDNGLSKKLYKFIRKFPVLLVKNPINFGPSEARNIGAFFARGSILSFIDDDAAPSENYIEESINALNEPNVIGARGRILKGSEIEQSPHYDLGTYVQEASFNLEGNMAICKRVFFSVGGFDLLMFGHEGHELAERCRASNTGKSIVYWPGLILSHEFPSGQKLKAKRERQETGMLYREYRADTYHVDALPALPSRISKEGVSLILCNPSPVNLRSEIVELTRWCKESRSELIIESDLSGSELSDIIENVDVNKPVTILRSLSNSLRPISKRVRYQNSIVIEGNYKLRASWSAVASIIEEFPSATLDFSTALGAKAYSIRSKKLSFNDGVEPKVNIELNSDFLFRTEKRIKRQESLEKRKAYPEQLTNTLTELSNKIIHRCPYFDEEDFSALRPKKRFELQVGFLGSKRFGEELGSLCHVTPLSEGDSLDTEQLDILLVESALSATDHNFYLNISQKWQKQFARMKKPTVFWYTESTGHVSLFSREAAQFDYLYAAGKKSAEKLANDTGKSVTAINSYIAPPLQHHVKQFKKPSFSNLTVLYDGWADVLQFPENRSLLNDLGLNDVHIVDSQWQFNQLRLNETPELQSRIIGCMTEKQKKQALKEFKAVLFTSKTLQSTHQQEKQIIEALAAKTTVLYFVSSGSKKALQKRLGDVSEFIHFVDTVSGLNEQISNLKNKAWHRKVSAQKAWRFVNKHHSLAHGLKQLIADAKLGLNNNQPMVSCLTVTKRPHYVDTIITNFERQTYSKKELLVAINSSDLDIDSVEQKIKSKVPGAKVFKIGSERNIGFCLNWLISNSNGEYWAKMDDDDEYGPHYIEDYVINAENLSLDIIGKKMGPTYFEGIGKTLYRDPNSVELDDTLLYPGNQVHLAGATFFGKKSLIKTNAFSEKMRASVDVDFFKRAVASDKVILLADDFNLIVFRAADKSQHTWKETDSVLTERAEDIERVDVHS